MIRLVRKSAKLIGAKMMTLSEVSEGLASSDEKARWRAAAEASEYVYEQANDLWPLVLLHGSSADEDLRQAIATCVLEHILEHHFNVFFPDLESKIRAGNANLRRTLLRCSQLGQAEEPVNAGRWNMLVRSTSAEE